MKKPDIAVKLAFVSSFYFLTLKGIFSADKVQQHGRHFQKNFASQKFFLGVGFLTRNLFPPRRHDLFSLLSCSWRRSDRCFFPELLCDKVEEEEEKQDIYTPGEV